MKVERIYVNPKIIELERKIRRLEQENSLLNDTIDDIVEDLKMMLERLDD